MLSKNINFLKDIDKNLFNILSYDSTNDKIRIEKLEESNFILQDKNSRCFLHSIYNVQEEVKQMFKNVKEDTDAIILYGLGGGASLEYILSNFSNLRYLLIVEPSQELFKEISKSYDLSKLYEKFKFLKILVEPSNHELDYYISYTISKSEKASFVSHVTYSAFFSKNFGEVTKKSIEKIQFLKGNLNLAETSIYPWLINGIKNLKIDSIPIESISNIFKNKTVILVGAGPSLNKNIHLIKEARNKAIVIAGGSAIKILDSHDIKPDFRIAIDGLLREKKMLEGISVDNIPLLFTNNLYYEIAAEYKAPLIRLINTSENIGKYIYKKEKINHMTFDSGTSVINSALSLVCQSDCKKVIFIGQDLSYTQEGKYAKGSNFSELKAKEGSEIYKKMKDIFGQDVYTTDVMLTMKYSIESIIKKFPKIQFINATEGGLDIEGTMVKNLEASLDDIPIELQANINDIVTNNDSKYMKKIYSALEAMKREVEELLTINNEIYTLILKAETSKKEGKEVREILKELKRLEDFNFRLKANAFYDEVLVKYLNTLLQTVVAKYEYNGSDVNKKIDSIIKISLNRVVEAQKYATLANELLKET